MTAKMCTRPYGSALPSMPSVRAGDDTIPGRRACLPAPPGRHPRPRAPGHRRCGSRPLWTESLVTFGSQAAFFHICDPRGGQLTPYGGSVPVHLPPSLNRWTNLWESLDVLAFAASKVFQLHDGTAPVDLPVPGERRGRADWVLATRSTTIRSREGSRLGGHPSRNRYGSGAETLRGWLTPSMALRRPAPPRCDIRASRSAGRTRGKRTSRSSSFMASAAATRVTEQDEQLPPGCRTRRTPARWDRLCGRLEWRVWLRAMLG